MARWGCAGAPLEWSKPAPSSAGSTATSISGHCEPRSNGMSLPETSEPTSTIKPATSPDDHPAAVETLRSSRHPHFLRVNAYLHFQPAGLCHTCDLQKCLHAAHPDGSAG